MPTGADIKIDDNASFLLVGDSGSHKTTFIGTCPQPSFTFDFDDGFARHRGRSDMSFERFKELPKKRKLDPKGQVFTNENGWYEWGTAWPAFLKKLNEIGVLVDKGENPYKTLGVDSYTLMIDCAMNYVLKENNRDTMEIRDWGAFLNNMSNVTSQLVSWPMIKVFTAHVKRDENQITGAIEQLPLIPGQFAGKVSVYFDEVYFCIHKNVAAAGQPSKQAAVFKTQPDAVYRQAKSRRYNLPDYTLNNFQAVLDAVKRMGTAG